MLEGFLTQGRQDLLARSPSQPQHCSAGAVQGIDYPVNGINGLNSRHFGGFFLLALNLQCQHQKATGHRRQADQQGYQKLEQTAAGKTGWSHDCTSMLNENPIFLVG
ncbi:hypothetical protein D3C76_1192690 [compost metagenome]